MRWRPAWVLVVASSALVAACGGLSVRRGDGDGEAGASSAGKAVGAGGAGIGGGATGGTGGAAGTAATGGAAGGLSIHPPVYCEFNGMVVAVGETVSDPALCLSCTCNADNDLDCTQCDATCRVSSGELHVGDGLTLEDGCTVCVCTVGGMDCKSDRCAQPDPCRDLVAEYELAVGAERWCGPAYGGFTCANALQASASIPCGCPVLVRSLDAITPIAEQYFAMGCKSPEICSDACEAPRQPYRCGEAGFCLGAIH